MRDLTQAVVARRLGIDVLQLRDHEDGTVRIDAMRLFAVACLLDMPISSFLTG